MAHRVGLLPSRVTTDQPTCDSAELRSGNQNLFLFTVRAAAADRYTPRRSDDAGGRAADTGKGV